MRLILGSHTAVGIADTGTSVVDSRTELVEPTYVIATPDHRGWYAISEDPDGPGRVLYDDGSGTVSRLESGGHGPCHLSMHPGQSHLLVAHYTGGSIAAVSLEIDGGLGEVCSVAEHTGSGPVPQRQQGPHVHQAVTDPSGEWILAADLGADQVVVYRLRQGRLRRHSVADFSPGQGVRHLAFAPDGRRAFVTAELSSQLVACDWDAEAGILSPVESMSTIADTTVVNYPGAVLISTDGRWIYVTNRGHDSVAVVDAQTFAIHTIVDCGGTWPRDACLSHDGAILFVANERSGNVAIFDVADGGVRRRDTTIDFAGVTSVNVL